MRSKSWVQVVQVSLAIFAMLFGAGNLMLPLKVGLLAGSKSTWGLIGFILTGVLLPLLGLLSIIAFDGNYKAFFGRLGRIPGAIATFLCMLVLGPIIVMPRIVGLSYEMLTPFLPSMHVSVFAFAFLSLVFLATYRPTKLLTVIGTFLSPLKVLSLCIIVLAGLFSGLSPQAVTTSASELFKTGAQYGFGTLDLLGTIFFGSIVVGMLKMHEGDSQNASGRIRIALMAGIAAAALLGLVYAGMNFLGAFHGQGLEHLNEGQLFSAVSFNILGTYGAALIGFTVFLACFTTTVALTAVVTEYIHIQILSQSVGYTWALLGVLAACLIPASLGLSAIMKFSMPLIQMLYPVLIVIAACNAMYKLWGFTSIKLPVGLTLAGVIGYALLKSFF